MADGHHESKLLKISFALKDTQLTQTCSQGHIFLLLYVTVMFLCIWEVVTSNY